MWPGAVLVEEQVVDTWRRAEHLVTIRPWRRLAGAAGEAIEAEATFVPLPGLDRPITIR